MYRLVVQVLDDTVFAAGQDDPRVVYEVEVGTFRQKGHAEQFAKEIAGVDQPLSSRLPQKRPAR